MISELVSKTTPWRHQRNAYRFMCSKLPGAVMLALQMGCGKSKLIVDYVVNEDLKTTVILCPKSVIPVWKTQFETHAGCVVFVELLVKGTTVERAAQANHVWTCSKISGVRVVFVVNYEAARQPAMERLFLSWARAGRLDMLVLDESHKIKAPSGKASGFCKKLGKLVHRRVCLTGTPMPHSPLDLYGQYRFLNPQIFGTSFQAFKMRYARMGGFVRNGKPMTVIGFQNLDELEAKFRTIAYQCKAKDVLKLPDRIHTTRHYDLSKDERRVYNAMKKEFVAEVASGVVTAGNALTKLLRLAQITNGFARLDAEDGEDQKTVRIGDSRENLLVEILEGIPAGEPVVVFCRFHTDLDAVGAASAQCERPYCELSGRLNELSHWQNFEGAGVLGVQMQSGSLGVDLTKACYAVYYSLGYSLGDYEQSLARVHRPGQERTVVYTHIVANDTVDETIYAALRARKKIIDSIMENMT